MNKTRKFTNKTCLKVAAFLFFPCALFGGSALIGTPSTTNAAEVSYSYSEGYRETKNVTNPSFADGGKPFVSGNSLSGWTAIESSSAKGMIIDVGNKIESSEGEKEDSTFAQHKDSSYLLESNPETKDTSDTRILMINSKSESKQSNVETRKGYKSSAVTLQANSYYVFCVSAKTMLNGDAFAEASIYLSGLKDKDGKAFDLAYEKISPSVWSDYYFFVATGDADATVTLQLYLGSKHSDSQGVAFFDNTSIYRYSQNEFYSLAKTHGYNGVDSAEITAGDKIFMVDKLATEHATTAQTSTYNFDFEDETALVADNWTPIGKQNATANIIDYADFASHTGLPRIGNDLSYENDRALVMQTTSSEYSSSYIGLKSKDITIEPHSAYRISLKLKIADMQSGSFYLKLSENDYIYSVYTEELSNDKEADNYLALASGKTNGYTSNASNAWTNDYQEIDYFVKGHALYTTNLNIELWLGDSTTSAVGCVVVDDIKVEKVADSKVDTSDCLSLYSTPSATISNSTFDTATSKTADAQYPLTAGSWTVSGENDFKNEAGVVYLDGRTIEGQTKSVYENMYDKAKYDWAGINPGNSDGSKTPANVYMLFNREDSYQTLKSPSFTVSSQEYFKISFDYYNQLFKTTTPSAIKVEIVDTNGIVLFSEDGISSYDQWAKMEVYFHSSATKSNSLSVNIYLGEKSAPVGGLVYIDNLSSEAATADDFAAAAYKTDISGFMTHLDGEIANTNKVVSSSAYTFSASTTDPNFTNSNCGFGGIVRGQDNAYGIENNKDNFLALTTYGASTLTLTSKFTLEFKENTYYKLDFSLATLLGDAIESEEHTCNYGVTITLEGYGEIANLTTDGSLKDFSIYFKTPESATTPTLSFSLTSDCNSTVGSALLTNLALSESDSDKYLAVQNGNAFGKTVHVSEYKPAEDEGEEETPDVEEDVKTEVDPSLPWLLASSIITAVAVIIGVVALAFKKIKFKKIEKIKSANYDKRLSKNRELVVAQAQKLRDQELENLQAARKSIEQQKEAAEQEHREFMRVQREKDKNKISRTVEKAFKAHTSNIAAFNEKLNIINEKITYTMSPEHLLELQRKLVAQEDETAPKSK